VVRLSELVKRLRERLSVLEDDMLGGARAQAGYEKGLALLAAALSQTPIENQEAMRRELERQYCQRLQLALREKAPGTLERQALKEEYGRHLPQLEKIRVRPHHLLCLLCTYGEEGGRPSPNNNCWEIIQKIRDDPEVLLEIVAGTDDNCIPCPSRVGSLCVAESAIRDLKKDQDVLERTGLRIGDVRPARAAYALVMKNIPTVQGICTFEEQDPPVWRDCSTASRGFYESALSKGLWP